MLDRLDAYSSVPFLDFSISKDSASTCLCFAQFATEAPEETAVRASAVLKFLLVCDINRGASESD